jgi:hypothetical protein
MKHLFFFFILTQSLLLFSQDSLFSRQKFLKTQSVANIVLSSWSVGNLIVNPVLKNNFSMVNTSSSFYFYQMNFSWNLVNSGISALSYLSLKKAKKNSWNIVSLNKDIHKVRKSLAINMGLDICYSTFGILLRSNSLRKNLPMHQYKGYGNSLILQGGFLFLFDLIYFTALNSSKNKKVVNLLKK